MSNKRNIASLAENHKGEKVIKIMFENDLNMIEKIRKIPGRGWHPENKCWSAPLHENTIRQLQNWGFVIHEDLQNILLLSNKVIKEITSNGIAGLKGKLFPYQSEGVAFIENNKGRALISDETGLGKTIMTLAWLQMHPKKRPVTQK